MSDTTPDKPGTSAVASVDSDVCVGHGGCRRIAPSAFVRTNVGQSEFVDARHERDALIIEAAANCPVAAITVHARDTGHQLYP